MICVNVAILMDAILNPVAASRSVDDGEFT